MTTILLAAWFIINGVIVLFGAKVDAVWMGILSLIIGILLLISDFGVINWPTFKKAD